jgi:hypothetical protein
MEPVALPFAEVGVGKKSARPSSPFNFDFKIHTQASQGEELTMSFRHGRRDHNFYIEHNGRVLATIIDSDSDKGMVVNLADPSVFNQQDANIAMLKIADGIAQRVQHLSTTEAVQ